MSARHELTLIEGVTSAFRERSTEGRILPAPEWWDLSPEGRREAYRELVAARALERALDPEGLSTTARAVLRRIAGIPQLAEGEA
jgi:hypothetical protein